MRAGSQAHGLPCVATEVGGIPDTLENGKEGVIVPAGNPTALADAIQTLIDDPNMRASFGKAARDRVVRDFSIVALAAKCVEIYESITRTNKVADRE